MSELNHWNQRQHFRSEKSIIIIPIIKIDPYNIKT